MADVFFKLKEPYGVFYDRTTFFNHIDSNKVIKDALFRPESLVSPISPQKWRIVNKIFQNFSFAKTHIKDMEFKDCVFEGCLFIASIFYNCRFTGCTFISCNMHRFELRNVFVEPKSFEKCIPSQKYANVGVHLFQELLRNSRMQAQPDYADDAQYMFRRWQRYLNKDGFSKSTYCRMPGKALAIFWGYSFELLLGSGVRLRNLAGTTAFLIFLLTFIHWVFRSELGLSGTSSSIDNWLDAFYFTAVTLTTLGYGDITPTTEIGRILVGLEALLGFVLFATLASTVFRRFSS